METEIEIKDNRTEPYKSNQKWCVFGLDNFMSNHRFMKELGRGEYSFAAWCCDRDQIDEVKKSVQARSDFDKYLVRHCKLSDLVDEVTSIKHPSDIYAISLYSIEDEHPAINGGFIG